MSKATNLINTLNEYNVNNAAEVNLVSDITNVDLHGYGTETLSQANQHIAKNLSANRATIPSPCDDLSAYSADVFLNPTEDDMLEESFSEIIIEVD